MWVFSGQRQHFSTASGCIYRWMFQVSFSFIASLPCCFQVASTISLSLSPMLGLYTVLGSNYPLSGFTAVLLIQKPFVNKDFLNSPRSCSDFFNSSLLRSNWNAEVTLASPWCSCPQASRNFLLCRILGKKKTKPKNCFSLACIFFFLNYTVGRLRFIRGSFKLLSQKRNSPKILVHWTHVQKGAC